MGYPPCENHGCNLSSCCAPGFKYQWKELLDQPAAVAKAIIEKENPKLTAVIIDKGFTKPPFTDFCCNRVVVYVSNGKVAYPIPTIG